jgi:hypothetical protein
MQTSEIFPSRIVWEGLLGVPGFFHSIAGLLMIAFAKDFRIFHGRDPKC